MKKSTSIQAVTISAFLLLLNFSQTQAQNSHVAILMNMVHSRLNYGDKNSSLQDYRKPVRGLQAGLSWQAGVTEHFSVVTEAYFVNKGGRLKSGNPLDGIGTTLKLSTMEVPILARVHAGRFYFNAGPYTNYIFSGKITSKEESEQSISLGDGQEDFKRFEAGMQTGGGVQFRIKKTKMALDIRYTHGMTSISRTDDLYNRTINITVLAFMSLKRQSN